MAWLTLVGIQLLLVTNLAIVIFYQCLSYKYIIVKLAIKYNCYCKWCHNIKLPKFCQRKKKLPVSQTQQETLDTKKCANRNQEEPEAVNSTKHQLGTKDLTGSLNEDNMVNLKVRKHVINKMTTSKCEANKIEEDKDYFPKMDNESLTQMTAKFPQGDGDSVENDKFYNQIKDE